MSRTHRLAHLHIGVGWTAVVALIALGVWRWTAGAPGIGYLLMAWLIMVLVLLQGWLGGEMVYAHGAGVAATGQGQSPAQKAQRPSRSFYRLLTGRDLDEDEDEDEPGM